MKPRQYSCPRHYVDKWKVLLQQHLDKGRIHPSSSPYCSPAFIIPKKDPNTLPRWVNDYRKLNDNTIPDSHPLPRMDDILAGVSHLTQIDRHTDNQVQTIPVYMHLTLPVVPQLTLRNHRYILSLSLRIRTDMQNPDILVILSQDMASQDKDIRGKILTRTSPKWANAWQK